MAPDPAATAHRDEPVRPPPPHRRSPARRYRRRGSPRHPVDLHLPRALGTPRHPARMDTHALRALARQHAHRRSPHTTAAATMTPGLPARAVIANLHGITQRPMSPTHYARFGDMAKGSLGARHGASPSVKAADVAVRVRTVA